jgi:ligand-binding sensor domain-containing protein
MRPQKTIFLLYLLLSLGVQSQPGNYYQQNFTIRDGLPCNHIRWITQDKMGFLWIGTWDGLARFDGIDFKIYRHNPNDSNSIAFFEIQKVVVDSANRVWVLDGGRICKYDRNHDNFVRYGVDHFPDLGPRDGPPEFFDILVDPDGFLVVVYGIGFYRYDPVTDRFKSINGKSGITWSFNPSLSAFDNLHNLWFLWIDRPGSKYAFAYKCNYNNKQGISVTDSFACRQDNFNNRFIDETIRTDYYVTIKGQPIITSTLGLFILENDTFRLSNSHLPEAKISGTDILMWSQPEKGLMIYYPEEDHIDTLNKRGEIASIITYFHDAQGNIWFGDYSNSSITKGLNLVFRTGDYFKLYLYEPGKSNPNIIFGLCKDTSGNIWAGGRPNDHIIKLTPDGREVKIDVPFHPVTYYNFPRNIICDDEGNLWISFFHDYLYRYNPVNSEFKDYSAIDGLGNATGVSKNFRLIHQLEKYLMIAAGGGRIYIINTKTGDVLSSSTIDNRDIFSIYHDTGKKIWLGLSGKLFKCDYDLQSQELIDISDQFYNIEDICPGDNHDLWLAMLGGGIGHFDIQSGKTTFYTTFNGLAHNTVYSILKDKSGNMWVSHDLGISLFNASTESFTNYNEKDGLKIREFDSEAACQTTEGEMLFGGVGGIVSFYPDSVKKSRRASPADLIISEFRVSNEILMPDFPLHDPPSVTLPKGTDNFQITFVRPEFRYADEMRYRYLLKGSQSEWTVTDSKHRGVFFTSLRPGKYEFLCESTGLGGEWAYRTSLVIEIPKFFYQTIVFRLILVLIFLGLVFLFFMMKLKQTRLYEKRKQEQLRLESLRGQMNPHFIYNSLNSINYFISLNDRFNANQYITDFSRLMRAIMMNSSQEYISLESEIQAIHDYLQLEHLRFSNKFDFEVLVDDGIDQVSTVVTPSLVQPFIENAIWHGLRYLENRKGSLSVRIKLEARQVLACYIEDDGIGRQLSVKMKTGEQKKRKSRGIAIVQERLILINSFQKTNYTVEVRNLYNDREETGTRVRIEIPFKTE